MPTIHICIHICTCTLTGQCTLMDGITLLHVQAGTWESEVGVRVWVVREEAVGMLKARHVVLGHAEGEEGDVLQVVGVLVAAAVVEVEGVVEVADVVEVVGEEVVEGEGESRLR
jgi:hypothetical protein